MRRLLLLTLVAAVALTAAAIGAPRGTPPTLTDTTAFAVSEMCTPARPHASGTTNEAISTPTGLRNYRLHVPPSYTGADPVPVVFSFHGAGSNPVEQEIYSNFSTKSDAEGFIAVYPEGKITNIPFTHFNAWQFPAPPEHDDVALVSAIIDALNTQLCIDLSRVYSTGISNGGMMSTRLACSLSHRIAAIAPVAGAYFPPMASNVNAAENCPDTAARPFLAFHGTADATVPYNGGPPAGGGANYRLPQDDNTPADDVLASWAAHNGCIGPRQETFIDTEVTLIEYGSCVDGAAARLYRVDPGGHTWPGSFDVPSLGYTTQQIDATDLIWAFFEQFTLPDLDADLVPDTADNCPSAANFSQLNTDRNFIDNSPPYAPSTDDKTRAHSDTQGDACDLDDDNDGRSDADEASGAGCSGAVTNPLVGDSDGDRALDGPECALGRDPTSAASAPLITDCGPVPVDLDGDKIADRIEWCYYNSAQPGPPVGPDMDGDGTRDGCEIASINSDRIVSSGDQGMLASGIAGMAGYTANADINKDGVLSSGDQGIMASFITPPGQCP